MQGLKISVIAHAIGFCDCHWYYRSDVQQPDPSFCTKLSVAQREGMQLADCQLCSLANVSTRPTEPWPLFKDGRQRCVQSIEVTLNKLQFGHRRSWASGATSESCKAKAKAYRERRLCKHGGYHDATLIAPLPVSES